MDFHFLRIDSLIFLSFPKDGFSLFTDGLLNRCIPGLQWIRMGHFDRTSKPSGQNTDNRYNKTSAVLCVLYECVKRYHIIGRKDRMLLSEGSKLLVPGSSNTDIFISRDASAAKIVPAGIPQMRIKPTPF